MTRFEIRRRLCHPSSAVKRIWPSRPIWPGVYPVDGSLRPDVPDEFIVDVQEGQSRIELSDNQSVAPLGETAGTAEEGRSKCPHVSPLEVIDLNPPILAISDVELNGFAGPSVDIHRMRAQESAPALLARKPGQFDSVLVESVHDARAVAV